MTDGGGDMGQDRLEIENLAIGGAGCRLLRREEIGLFASG